MATEHKNEQIKTLIRELKIASSKNDAPVWRAVAEDLERPTRQQPVVNLAKLNRFTKQGETIVVPGKVLGDGELDHSITVAALGFSTSAQDKLKKGKATISTIMDLIKKDPKGKSVRVLA
jgi:large subunit ribosomal protein L18e